MSDSASASAIVWQFPSSLVERLPLAVQSQQSTKARTPHFFREANATRRDLDNHPPRHISRPSPPPPNPPARQKKYAQTPFSRPQPAIMASPADAEAAVAVAVALANGIPNTVNGLADAEHADASSQSQSQLQSQSHPDASQVSGPSTKRKREDSDDGFEPIQDANQPKLVFSDDQQLRDEKDLIRNYFQVLQRYAKIIIIVTTSIPCLLFHYLLSTCTSLLPSILFTAQAEISFLSFESAAGPLFIPDKLNVCLALPTLHQQSSCHSTQLCSILLTSLPVSTPLRPSSSDRCQNRQPPMNRNPRNKSPTTVPNPSASRTRSTRTLTGYSTS